MIHVYIYTCIYTYTYICIDIQALSLKHIAQKVVGHWTCTPPLSFFFYKVVANRVPYLKRLLDNGTKFVATASANSITLNEKIHILSDAHCSSASVICGTYP